MKHGLSIFRVRRDDLNPDVPEMQGNQVSADDKGRNGRDGHLLLIVYKSRHTGTR